MKRANLRYIAPITISLLIPFGLFAATQFTGPTQSPTGGNTPGVIWDMSAGGSQNATINISGPATINGATTLNGSISTAGTVITDINLSDTRALRVDKNGQANYNMGNWYGGSSKPLTFNVNGDLKAYGFGGYGVGESGTIYANQFCFHNNNCVNTTWPSGGGGGVTSIANGGGLTVTNPSGPATTLSVIDNYVNTTGDTMSGVLTMNGSYGSYQPLVDANNGGVNGYGVRARGYSGGVLGYANNSSGFGVYGSNPAGYYAYLGTGSYSIYGYGPAYFYNTTQMRDKLSLGLDATPSITLDPGLASGIADVRINGDVSVLNSRNICLGGVCRNSWPAAGGSPGGANQQIQYNSSGVFAGDSDFIWDSTNNRLGIRWATPLYNIDIGNGGGIATRNNFNYVANTMDNSGLKVQGISSGGTVYGQAYLGSGGDEAGYFSRSRTYNGSNLVQVALSRKEGGTSRWNGIYTNGPADSNYVGGWFSDYTTTRDVKLVTGSNSIEANGNVSIANTGSLFLGSLTRQMVNLFGSTYGFGVQSATEYFRTNGNFAWFKGGSHSNTAYDPGSGGSKLMHLDGNGSLWLGTGLGDTAGYYFYNRNTPSYHFAWFAANISGVNQAALYSSADGGYKIRINGNAIYNPTGSASWTTTSDVRLKQGIKPYKRGLAEVSKLSPIEFRYIDTDALSSKDVHQGLIAQQVQQIIPEAVTEDQTGYLQINNDPIIWASVNAIKELKAENDDLKARIEKLEAKLGN